jgi:hypothetical protein
LTKAELDRLVEEATVDCHDEAEQLSGLYTMIDDNLALPFETQVLGTLSDTRPGAARSLRRGTISRPDRFRSAPLRSNPGSPCGCGGPSATGRSVLLTPPVR